MSAIQPKKEGMVHLNDVVDQDADTARTTPVGSPEKPESYSPEELNERLKSFNDKV